MERLRVGQLARAAAGIGACTLAAIGLSGAPAALASPPTVTLSGQSADGGSPDSAVDEVNVSATLSNGVATGFLNDWGKRGEGGGHLDVFNGNVTCMVIRGNHAVVGAFGLAWEDEAGLKDEKLQFPGTYAQVLTLEFTDTARTPSFGLQFGEHNIGVQSDSPPSCTEPYSFLSQHLPSWTEWGLIYLSPSITSPTDGYVNRNGVVNLLGTGEPYGVIKVYEVGHEASATEVTANAKGRWSLKLSGLSAGTHVFTASPVNGSPNPANKIPANTVEVEVRPRHSRCANLLSGYRGHARCPVQNHR